MKSKSELDNRLEEIIKKYIENFKENVDILDIVNGMIKRKIKNKKFIIWGAGEHTIELQKYMSYEIREVEYFVDSNKDKVGKSFLGKDIKEISDLKNDKKIEVILISTQFGENKVIETIKKQKIKCEVIGIYEYLKSIGVEVSQPFYREDSNYLKLYTLKKNYEKEKNKKKLEMLISNYLEIRDFKNALEYMDVYIENFGVDKITALKEEVEKFLGDISKTYKKKNYNILFLDALRYKDIEKMKFLKKIREGGTSWERMYSIGTSTYEVITSMLKGKQLFEMNDKENCIVEKECDLTKYLIEKNISINIITINQWDILNGDHINHQYSGNIAKSLWKALTNNYFEEKQCLNLIYILQETHPPHICGKHKNKPEVHYTPFTSNSKNIQNDDEYANQYYESLEYVDKQIEFYSILIFKKDENIIFSDHGQIIEGLSKKEKEFDETINWTREKYHVPFIYFGQSAPNIKLDGISSLVDFNKIIINILKENFKALHENREYAKVEGHKIYNNVIRKKFLEKNLDEAIDEFTIYNLNEFKVVLTCQNIKKYNFEDEEKEILDDTINEELINKIGKEEIYNQWIKMRGED